jgi:hypothetical protein
MDKRLSMMVGLLKTASRPGNPASRIEACDRDSTSSDHASNVQREHGGPLKGGQRANAIVPFDAAPIHARSMSFDQHFARFG